MWLSAVSLLEVKVTTTPSIVWERLLFTPEEEDEDAIAE
jgi:hypothetical protein